MKIADLSVLSIFLLTLHTVNNAAGWSRFERHIRTGPPCPPEWDITPCTCSGHPSAPTIDCSLVSDTASLQKIMKASSEGKNSRAMEIHGSSLTSLSASIFSPHNFYLFLLSNNSITTVDKDAFKGSEESAELIRLDGNKLTTFPFEGLHDLKSLRILQLNRNQLTAVNENAFPLLETLEMVDLSSNKISSIGKNAFSQLPTLTRLDLSNNQLTSIGEGALTISKQKHPLTLILAKNKIQSIDEDIFAGLKVELVNLEQNNLSILNENIFGRLIKDGAEIAVEGNSFNCDDSRMTWIVKLAVISKQRVSGFRCSNGKTLDQLN